MVDRELMEKAREAKQFAYAPYSGFRVGAAVLTKSGTVYTGCNVESASFGATNCAERVALQKAISEGEREFLALAVAGDAEMTTPCGICRQVISELAPNARILVSEGEQLRVFTAESLLPHAFGRKDLL